MFGKNKILKPEIHNGKNLDVQEIFPTLQGEGPYAGTPSVFIRLGGCNLACNFCDTEFDSYKNFSLEKILEKVVALSKNSEGKIVRKLVVITGGEPLRQPIELLCKKLLRLKFEVQIETNGTLFRDLPKKVKIICSPKSVNGKYYKIRPDLLSRITAFKFLLSKTNKNYSEIPSEYEKTGIEIYAQPIDEYDKKKNSENLKYAMKLCETKGYRLSLQIHKILQIR